jgi:uncharacterized membrane protein
MIGHEPPYVIKLGELVWGLGLLAITTAIHGIGMLWTLRVSGAFAHRFRNAQTFAPALGRVVLATWMITSVHLVEVFVWAWFFIWKDAVANRANAYYVALMNYTTLGCEYDLVPDWRLLEGMTGIAGLMTFAWSTGVLMTLAQNFQDSALKFRLLEEAAKLAPKPAGEVAPPASQRK